MIGFLVFGLVILSTICLWLLIEQRKSWKFLIWFIPIIVFIHGTHQVAHSERIVSFSLFNKSFVLVIPKAISTQGYIQRVGANAEVFQWLVLMLHDP